MNVFLAAGRPPGMEQLHQEAQLNLQSLLQGSKERGWGGLGEGDGWVLPGLGDCSELISHTCLNHSLDLTRLQELGPWGPILQ